MTSPKLSAAQIAAIDQEEARAADCVDGLVELTRDMDAHGGEIPTIIRLVAILSADVSHAHAAAVCASALMRLARQERK